MDSFSVQVVHTDAQTILRLSGELDMATSAEAEAGVEYALRQTPTGGCLVVDVSDLAFCDVIGLREVLRAHACAVERGSSFVLRSPSAMLSRLITAAGLSESLLPVPMPAQARGGPSTESTDSVGPSPVSLSRDSGIPIIRDEHG